MLCLWHPSLRGTFVRSSGEIVTSSGRESSENSGEELSKAATGAAVGAGVGAGGTAGCDFSGDSLRAKFQWIAEGDAEGLAGICRRPGVISRSCWIKVV